jgi:hypothetical protein
VRGDGSAGSTVFSKKNFSAAAPGAWGLTAKTLLRDGTRMANKLNPGALAGVHPFATAIRKCLIPAAFNRGPN